MALPSYVQACAGVTDAGGAFEFAGAGAWGANLTPDNIVIYQILQDGVESGTITGGTGLPAGMSDLAGTVDQATFIGTFDVGSAVAARQHIWIARCNSSVTNSARFPGGNSGTDDVYCRAYEFTDVNIGTTLADVIENATAGTATSGVATNNTVADVVVETLGVDRLALQFVAVNDDNALGAFSAGGWSEIAAGEFATATGTDGCIDLYTQNAATAGTYGGSGQIVMGAADAWGIVAFALIGTTAAGPATSAPPHLFDERRRVSRRGVIYR